ncbi:hypothetical protein SAMN05216456_3414 [Devosia crocina]|uniref:Nutrient deprivation-induced protein n=1 Tax=Devosia crocina TaxID=429728 RepID=A0A1I7NUS7_9HYPH|nr:hypothetical protein [Devosia crocina]SFV38407.1 hypothetical protein SAMN05216456_3414 [Devosia crocina]
MSIEDPNRTSGTANTPSSELQQQASQDLNEVTSRAKDDLDTIKQQAAADTRELKDQAQEKLGEATDKAKSFAAHQKDLAASQITGVADAISKVASELEGSEQQTVARYARDLAGGLSKVGKQIENRDVDDLMGAAQDFGRNQPVAFLGVAALAGFVASRFALASTHRRDQAATTSSTSGTSNVSGVSSASGVSSTSTRPVSSSYDTGYRPNTVTGDR